MIRSISRIIGRTLGTRQASPRRASLKDLASIRRALIGSFDDCEGESAQRLCQRIETARTPQELWLLRNDAYQIIAQRHDQAVATERINGLIPTFQGCMDPRQIGPV
ncbi:MAG: hypothetical protein R3E99_11240 [Burkholderiaceae bacterium]